MTEQKQVYKCPICGIMVEVLHEWWGELVCCGQPMGLIVENTVDAAVEKHKPVITQTESGVKVSVGSVLHPMESTHYIEWIEIIADSKVFRKYLKVWDQPEAHFNIKTDIIEARAYCNLHGLWKS